MNYKLTTYAQKLGPKNLCTKKYFSKWVVVTFAKGFTFARIHFRTNGRFCTRDTFPRRHFCTQGLFCTKGHFFTVTILQVETFSWRHLLHGVIFLQKYLCTAKILTNQTISNRASFLHAAKFLFLNKI